MIHFSINTNFAGAKARSTEYTWRLLQINGVPRFAQVSAEVSDVDGDAFIYRLTGIYINRKGTNFYQTDNGTFLEWNESCSIVENSGKKYGAVNAQNQVDSIIKNNKRIYENNLLCARYSHLLTDAQIDNLKSLQFRMQNRDAALRNTSLLSHIRVAYPKGYIQLYPYLQNLKLDGAVGSITISTSAMIVVGAIVVAALGSAAYWAYSYYYKQALEDVKYSDELTAILKDKLTDAEYEQLREETAGMITKSTLAGRFSGAFSLVKYLAIGAVGYIVYRVITENQE